MSFGAEFHSNVIKMNILIEQIKTKNKKAPVKRRFRLACRQIVLRAVGGLLREVLLLLYSAQN